MSVSKLARKYCCEDVSKIENYEQAINDKSHTWDCHHRLELHPDFTTRFTRDSLIKLNLYFNRPASELIFLTKSEHLKIHRLTLGHKGGIPLSDSHKKSLSESHKGITTWNKGKHLSEEHKKHLSESLKGRVRTEEANEKFRQTMTGRKRKPFTKEWKHNLGNYTRGKTWKVIDGKRVWFEKEVS